jgi:hypothetical protein
MEQLTLAVNVVFDMDEAELDEFIEDFDGLMRKYVQDVHSAYMAKVSAVSIPEYEQVEG